MKTLRQAPATKKEVGIWIRVSTEDQAQGDSPKHHETRARAYAESRGWIVRELYDLSGVSGKSVADHPQAKRMMEDVRKGHIQALIFSKLARLARNTRELLDFADFFEKYKADLISLQESIDTSTPAGRLFYTMIAAMAQWEREEITDRINASMAVRAKSGKPLNGRPAFGYKFDKAVNKVVPHPEEAPVRKLIYQLFAQHKRKGTVARLLDEGGYRNRRRATFSRRGVEYLIQDTTAKGEYRSNHTCLSADEKQMLRKPEHEWVVTQVEPIVSKELWQQCNDILDNRRTARESKPGPRPVHPFAGFIRCECGEKMYVKSNTPKYVCWKCKNKIAIVEMDNHFREHLSAYLIAPEKATAYVESANNHLAEKKALLDSLRSQLREVKEESEKLYKLYNASGLTADQFKARFAPLDTRREQLEEEIPKTEGLIAAATVEGMSTQMIISDGMSLNEKWPKMTPEEKRRTVETVVRQIVVTKEDIQIALVYLPALEDMVKRGSNRGLQPTVLMIGFKRVA